MGLPLLSEYQSIAQACSLMHDKPITFSGSCIIGRMNALHTNYD